jgi:hypothetical protein
MAAKDTRKKRKDRNDILKDDQTKKVDAFKKPKIGEDSDNTPPEVTDKLGYMSGYNIKETYESSTNRLDGDLDNSKLLDPHQPSKYGNVGKIISKKPFNFPYPIRNFNFFNSSLDYEDPAFLTFDIFLYTDNESALFDDQTPYGVNAFLRRNDDISEDFSQRLIILDEFRSRIGNLFYTTDNDTLYTKSHYIQSIDGIEKFKQPIIKYKEDKISITLGEDIKMSAEYITELYNNLSYDYKFKRKAIPENCLRFDMAVMISDIRRFNNKTPKSSTPSALIEKEDKNVSREIFILRDCNFDFMKSFNVKNSISQGGFGAQNPEISTLQFDIYYKSAERSLLANLFDQTNEKSLDLITHKGTTNETNHIYGKGGNFTSNSSHYKYPINLTSGTTENKIGRLDNVNEIDGGVRGLTDRLLKTVTDVGSKNLIEFKNQAFTVIKQKKGKLLDSFRQQISDTMQAESIFPSNVYVPDFNKLSLENFIKGLSADLFSQISSEIVGETSNEADDILNNLGI